MSNGFTVTVYNPERAKMFEAVFRSTTVPVRSFIPQRANLPGKPDTLIYLLDLTRIDADQRAHLVAHLVERFNAVAADVERELDANGLPILASDCVASGLDIRQLL